MVAAVVVGAPPAGAATTTTFSYTGAEQTYSVPAGATAVTVTAVGAPGGPSWTGVLGGDGATVTATVPLAAGTTTLYVEVGGPGTKGPCTNASYVGGGGGFNGGGSTVCGGGGGGASDVRTTSVSTVAGGALTSADDSRLVVAGGGGGGGNDCGTPGGTAGDATATGAGAGGAGSDTCGGATAAGNGGLGGTSGGLGGPAGSTFPCAGGDGSLGTGGNASATCDISNYGGAGGGGFYGGGAGGDGYMSGGGGGAGTSFWLASATAVSMGEDSSGIPVVEITPVVPALDLSLTDTAPATVGSGQDFSYSLAATNTGGSSATGVVISDALPTGAIYASVSSAQASCRWQAPASRPRPKGGTVVCAIGTLGPGESVAVTVTMKATSPGTLTDSAAVTADNVVADADDCAGAVTDVQGG